MHANAPETKTKVALAKKKRKERLKMGNFYWHSVPRWEQRIQYDMALWSMKKNNLIYHDTCFCFCCCWVQRDTSTTSVWTQGSIFVSLWNTPKILVFVLVYACTIFYILKFICKYLQLSWAVKEEYSFTLFRSYELHVRFFFY